MSVESVDLTVDGIALGGDGVGRTEEGRVVFIPGTVPGDRVRAELTERRKRWARGRVVELYEAGPGRVEPSCVHAGVCGGCQVMHMDRASQLESLRQGVSDVLSRIGRVDVEVDPVVAGERALGYRNRITTTVRRRGGRVYAGYHSVRGRRIVDVDRCPLAEPAVEAAWSELRGAWGAGASLLPPGGELRLTLRASADGAVGMMIVGGRPCAPTETDRWRKAAGRVLDGVTGLESIWWRPLEAERVHLAGLERLRDTWLGIELDLLPDAFVQVNREVTELLEADLDGQLGPVSGKRILDLYAGVGLRGIRWSASGADVISVEAERDAVETGRQAAAGAGSTPEFVHARVEDVLPRGLAAGADVIVVNPPRSGLDAAAAESLCAVTASRLVYVSCDPATLARDVDRLSSAWTPVRARPFDAFPQTGHVETVLWFKPREGEAA
jgi:23S rRNA (uracil1939-C5)-methyltransferase